MVRSWRRFFLPRSRRRTTATPRAASRRSRRPRRKRRPGGCSAGSTCFVDKRDVRIMRYVATLEGAEHEIEIEELSADSFAIRFGAHRFEADLRKVGPASFSVIVDNRSFDFDVVRDGEEIVVASRTGSKRLSIVDAAGRSLRRATKSRKDRVSWSSKQ